MKVSEFVKRVVIPAVSALFLAALFYTLCMGSGQCDYLKLWWLMGIPFGLHRMFVWIIPRGHDIGSSIGILFINVLAGGVIGGTVLAWRLLAVAVYLVKAAVSVVKWTVVRFSGKSCKV